MRMTLDNLEASTQRCLIKKIGELTNPSASCGNQTAFLNLPSEHESFRSGRPTDVLPKAESLSRGNCKAIEISSGDAKILNFALLVLPFAGVNLPPQLRPNFNQDFFRQFVGAGEAAGLCR